jgi:hypothetical protein
VGKTEAVSRHVDSQEDSYRVRMPAGGATRLTLEAMARAIGRPTRKCFGELRDVIMRQLSNTSLLVMDEFHQIALGRRRQPVTVETIREIFDETKCGLVLVWTGDLERLFNEAVFGKLLEQIDRRGVLKLHIPQKPSQGDVTALRTAYGFPPLKKPSDEYTEVTEIASKQGIGKLAKTLRMARGLAVKQRQELSWDHFLATTATNRRLASGLWKEEK